MAEKTRYTDEELEEFRQIINDKLALAKRDYDEMMRVLTNQDSNDVDDTSPTYKALEEGSATQTKEGIDRITGKLIPKERLRAVPHATLSVESKMNQSKR